MKNLIILVFLFITSCQATQPVSTDKIEILKTSQVLEVLADYQNYMWDKDSTSWHQPESLTILRKTQPIMDAYDLIMGLHERSNPAFRDSVYLHFPFKEIQVLGDMPQDYLQINFADKIDENKIILTTSGRMLVRNLEYQIFQLTPPQILGKIIYIKYYSGDYKNTGVWRYVYWKEK